MMTNKEFEEQAKSAVKYMGALETSDFREKFLNALLREMYYKGYEDRQSSLASAMYPRIRDSDS